MATIKTIAQDLLLAGPPRIPIYGMRGGSFASDSSLQKMTFDELISVMKKKSDGFNDRAKFRLYRAIMDCGKDFDQGTFYDIQHRLGFIDSNCSPLRCWNCGGQDFSYNDHYMDNILCEQEVNCKDCSKNVGYWAYGVWMP